MVASNSTITSPLFTLAPLATMFRICRSPALGGSRDGDGFKRFDGAAQLGVFDEFLALHLGGGNLGSGARKTNDTENKKSGGEGSYREKRAIAAKSCC